MCPLKQLLLATVVLVSLTAVAAGHEEKSAETEEPGFDGPVSEESLEDCIAPSQKAGEAGLEHCKDVEDVELLRKLREQVLPPAPTPQ